jgi:hypothetical protein
MPLQPSPNVTGPPELDVALVVVVPDELEDVVLPPLVVDALPPVPAPPVPAPPVPVVPVLVVPVVAVAAPPPLDVVPVVSPGPVEESVAPPAPEPVVPVVPVDPTVLVPPPPVVLELEPEHAASAAAKPIVKTEERARLRMSRAYHGANTTGRSGARRREALYPTRSCVFAGPRPRATRRLEVCAPVRRPCGASPRRASAGRSRPPYAGLTRQR